MVPVRRADDSRAAALKLQMPREETTAALIGLRAWLDSGREGLRATGDAPRVVRRRFDLLTEALGPDRRRAVGWTLARLLQNTLWDIEDGRTSIDPSRTAMSDALPGR